MDTFTFNGITIDIELPPGVFKPTTTTQFLVKHMGDLHGKVVLDLGCGTGPIAIAAVKMGAEKVYAVDIMAEACETTMRNVERNRVSDRVEVRQGNLFEPVTGLTFDIIVDDVSGMSEEVSRISPWYPKPIPTGGRDGTVQTIIMLREVQQYLKNNGYLLFPIISLSKSEKILSTAQEIFNHRLVMLEDKSIPFCDELKVNMELLERLKSEGLINFTQRNSRYFWGLSIYKANA
jgi:release factor glutamine methyltransferase